MTDQQYTELGRDIAAYIEEYNAEHPCTPMQEHSHYDLYRALSDIESMVSDRSPEPDDGP